MTSTPRPHASAGTSRRTVGRAASSSRAAITTATGASRRSGYAATNARIARSRTSSRNVVGWPAMAGCRSGASTGEAQWRSLRPSGPVASPRRGRDRNTRPPRLDPPRAALGVGAAARRLRRARRDLARRLAPDDVRPDGLADVGGRDRPRRPDDDERAVVEAASRHGDGAEQLARRYGAADRVGRRGARRDGRRARARLSAGPPAGGARRRRDRGGRPAGGRRGPEPHGPRRLPGPPRRPGGPGGPGPPARGA